MAELKSDIRNTPLNSLVTEELRQSRVAERSALGILAVAPAVISMALAVVVASDGQHTMLAGALVLGIGLGPMYPLLLSKVLHYGEHGSAVFVLAGCGSALLPMMTGLVSEREHSLRAGLLAPLVCAAGMMCLAWMILRRESNGNLPA